MKTDHAHPSQSELEDLGRLAVLVIDGDSRSTNFVHAILDPFGVAVVTARSAEEAAVMLAAITPDVVLCEIVLPGQNGLAFMRRVREGATRAISDVPAIAMTAAHHWFDAQAAQRAGFDLFVKKPLDPEQLPQIVARLAVKSRRGREPTAL